MSNAELSLQTLLIAAACLITSSCSLHQVQSSPPIPTTVPEKFDHALQGTPGSARWWEDFSVPALTAAVERALEGNLDLRVAWARLAQAAAVAEQAGAARLPQLDASLGAGYQRFWSPEPNVDLSGGEVNIGSKAVSHDAGQFQVSLAAGFEVDLWGRAASQENAAELDRAASRQDLSAIAVTIAAQVVETWTHLAEQLALQVLLERQLKASQTLLHLVKLRFMQGLVASLDVRQQRQQLTAIEAELPLVQGRIAVLRSRLAVLSGHAPQSGSFTIEPALMEPPPLPVVGLPISLLARRHGAWLLERPVGALKG
jgi:multidrug efflux system outer membrane protein